MKKLIALTCAASLLFSTTAFAQTFSDLPDTHWAQKVVEEMVEQKIISGYTDGTFRPKKDISKIESLILLARIAGINNYADAANTYLTQYTNTLSKYTTQYKKDVAYLLGTKVLNTSDLDNLLSADQINAPITREEMAVLITKVMGKEDEAKKNSLIILPFNDVSSITASRKPYVYYVYSQKIMAGIDNENFSPKTNVTRVQAACILQRIYKKVDIKPDTSNSSSNSSSTTGKISVLNGTITSVDTSLKTVFIKDSSGKTEEYEYDSSTEFYVNSTKETASEMEKGLKVTVTLKDSTYITLMKMTKDTTETVSGTISSFDTSDKTIKVTKNSKSTEYDYSSSTKFYLDGKSSTASKALKKNYSVTLTISDDEVTKVEVKTVSSKEDYIIGKITKSSTKDGYIIITDDDGEEYILMDDYIDEYDEGDEDYYFDNDTDFEYNGSSKTYKSVATSSYLYKKGYYVKITMDKNDYLTDIIIASKESNLTDDDDDDDVDEIVGKIIEADEDDGYLIIEDDDGEEYILMDEYLDEYDENDEDYYFDNDTSFSYNAVSKKYSAISTTSYLYKEGLYARITLDDDEYINKIELAAKKSAFTSSSSSSSSKENTIDDGYMFGYITELDDDVIYVKDESGKEYKFEIGSNCIIIERSSDDPEDELYYYEDDYDDILEEDDEVVMFVYKEKSSKYYTSLIILLD